MSQILENCEWLHHVLEELPTFQHPLDLKKLPDNAVYFFYEKGESQGHNDKLRITRIGTHRDGNFKKRISQHYVLDSSKMDFDSKTAAPHHRSIFRKNLGRALLNKNGNKEYISIWDKKFTESDIIEKFSHLRDIELEKRTESEITKIIQETFSFRFLIINDQTERMGSTGIEAKLIGTVSQCDKCNPSKDWLGNYSPIEAIRNSGLWLVQNLNSETINDKDRETILRYKQETLDWISSN